MKCFFFIFTIFLSLLGFLSKAQEITIYGRVKSVTGKSLSDVTVTINNSIETKANKKGVFILKLYKEDIPPELVSATKQGFKLNTWDYDSSKKIIEIKMSPIKGTEDNNDDKVEEKKLNTKEINTKTIKDEKQSIKLNKAKKNDSNNSIEKVKKDTVKKKSSLPKKIKSNFVVVITNARNNIPLEDVAVIYNNKRYLSNSEGEIIVQADSLSENSLKVPGYQVSESKVSRKNKYLLLHLKDTSEASISLYDSSKFEISFNQLEFDKQALFRNGIKLNNTIEELYNELNNARYKNQKTSISNNIERLKQELIDNELAFQEAKLETFKLLEKMKEQITLDNKAIHKIEFEKEKEHKEKILFSILLILAVVLLFAFIFFYRKIKQQKIRLEETYKDLELANKKALTAAKEISAARDMGQYFTSHLDFENHMQEMAKNVYKVFGCEAFGIGIFNSENRSLEFKNFVINGVVQPKKKHSIDDKSKLSSFCYRKAKDVIINNIHEDHSKYTINYDIDNSDLVSQIYLPLIIEDEPIGVLTLQSSKQNAFSDVNLSIFKTLAAYAAIAVSNSNAFSIIKEKNENITNSLRYAKRIQEVILPSEVSLKQSFTDYFSIYLPKDIVSGDFYWFTALSSSDATETLFIAVVDCTGHGVPGALMSMIGNTLLNEIINQKRINNTAEILNLLDERVKTVLKQESNASDEGMDVCLCKIEKNSLTNKILVSFTGAKRPLYFKRKGVDNEIQILSGDKKSIGSMFKSKNEFSVQNLELNKGDLLYLTSDGYVDQHNDLRKKIGSKRFLELLNNISSLGLDEQKNTLLDELYKHKGFASQRDDIAILGIKI